MTDAHKEQRQRERRRTYHFLEIVSFDHTSNGEKDIPDETGLVGTDSTLSRSLTVGTGAVCQFWSPVHTRVRE